MRFSYNESKRFKNNEMTKKKNERNQEIALQCFKDYKKHALMKKKHIYSLNVIIIQAV